MNNDEPVFAKSKELKEIIKKHGWDLYDVTNPVNVSSWEEFNRMKPCAELKIDHVYLFIPNPKEGETLSIAYLLSSKIRPSLRIDNLKDSDILFHCICPLIWFTHLIINLELAIAVNPKRRMGILKNSDNEDYMIMPIDKVVGIFEKSFKIIKLEEYHKMMETMVN